MASASLMQAGLIQLTMSTFLSVILYPRPGHKIMYIVLTYQSTTTCSGII